MSKNYDNATKILRKARQLIHQPATWIKGDEMCELKDDNGRLVETESGQMYAYCAIGAIHAAEAELDLPTKAVWLAKERLIKKINRNEARHLIKVKKQAIEEAKRNCESIFDDADYYMCPINDIITGWNDNSSIRHYNVLDAFDKAINPSKVKKEN